MLSVSSTKSSGRFAELGPICAFWALVLVLATLGYSAIGLTRAVLPLEGWDGSQLEQVLGWTLFTSVYVFWAWLPFALGAVAATVLLRLSRLAWLLLSLVLLLPMAVGSLLIFGYGT